MTVTKKPARKTADEFISRAPDGVEPVIVSGRQSPPPVVKKPREPRKRIMRGNKEQLTVNFDPDVVDRIDAAAAKLGLTRTGWINLAVNLQLAAAGA